MKILALSSVIIFVIAFTLYYTKTKQEKRMLQCAKESGLFNRLCNDMRAIGGCYIDEVSIEMNGVVVRSVFPQRTVLEHSFNKRGTCVRNKDIPRLVAIVIKDEFPALNDSACYKFTKYPIYRGEGNIEYGYRFMLRPKVRDGLYSAVKPIRKAVWKI